MARSSIVHDYEHPQPGNTATFTLDEKIQHSIAASGIEKPRGYVVSYHANPEVEKQHFGQTHPMKPWRLTLTNKIVLAYGMQYALDMYLSRSATSQELAEFHTEDYIDYLRGCVNTIYKLQYGICNIPYSCLLHSPCTQSPPDSRVR